MGRRPFVRERILEAAFDLVAREGWEAVSSRQIAAAAKVGAASMFKHFPTMEHLGRELYQVALTPLEDELTAFLASPRPARRLLLELCALVYGWYDHRPRALALLIFPPHAFVPPGQAADDPHAIRNRIQAALGLSGEGAALFWGALCGPLHDRFLRRRSGAMSPAAAAIAALLAPLVKAATPASPTGVSP